MPSPAENEAVVRRWLMDEHTHNPYCAVAKHQPCDCDATRQAPARAALAALRAQAEAGEQARESLRAVERIVTEDGRVSAYESADHLCNGKCPDMDDMKIRDPDCLPCVVMDFPAALTGEGTK